MDALPADLQQILDDIDRADRSADTLVADLSEEQFQWHPDGGRGWSIAQCLEHLATGNAVYGNAMQAGVDFAKTRGWTRKGPIASGFFGRRFVRSMEPQAWPRLTAPRKIQPGLGLPKNEVLRRFHAAHDRIRGLVRECAGIDVNRATFANPFLPLVKMRVGTGFRVIVAHDRRHLWQASRVRDAPGFPRATRD